MLSSLREALLALQRRDLEVRAALAADGCLYDGYHPQMEEVHRENAAALRRLIAEFGWPHEAIAGKDGAEAAWLVAQHAISEPAFQRACRDLLATEAQLGRVPRWHHAYLEDRINVSEGKPQRFGTQIDLTPDGPVVCEVAEPHRLDERRKEVGLTPIRERVKAMKGDPRPSVEQFQARKAAEREWRVKVGWSSAGAAEHGQER